MAYFSSGAAQAYANSFKPWRPNGGFENVKSDVAKELFGETPFLNFKAEVEMAKAGLQNYAANKKQFENDQAAKEIWEMKMEDADDSSPRKSKAAALSSLLAGGAGSLAGGGRKPGSSAYSPREVMGLLNTSNPMKDFVSFTQNDDALNSSLHNNLKQVTGATKVALQGGPAVPKDGGVQLQVPATTPTQLQTPPAPSLESSKEELEKIMKELVPSQPSGGEQK